MKISFENLYTKHKFELNTEIFEILLDKPNKKVYYIEGNYEIPILSWMDGLYRSGSLFLRCRVKLNDENIAKGLFHSCLQNTYLTIEVEGKRNDQDQLFIIKLTQDLVEAHRRKWHATKKVGSIQQYIDKRFKQGE